MGWLDWRLQELKARQEADFWLASGYQRAYQKAQQQAQENYLARMMSYFTAQGQSARRQYDIEAEELMMQAQLEEWNAHFAEVSGQMAGVIGSINAQQYKMEALSIKDQYDVAALHLRREMDQTMGSQVAIYGASGITMEGSPNRVLADTADQYHEDIETILRQGRYEHQKALNNAQIQEIQGQVQQAQGLFQGAMYRASAKSMRVSAGHKQQLGILAQQTAQAQAAAFQARFDYEIIKSSPEPTAVWNYSGGGFNTGFFRLAGIQNNPYQTPSGKRLLGTM